MTGNGGTTLIERLWDRYVKDGDEDCRQASLLIHDLLLEVGEYSDPNKRRHFKN